MPDPTFEKGDRLVRLLRVQRLLALRPQGWTPQALAVELGVSKRTIQRDLKSLELDLEMPMVVTNGHYALMPEFFLRPINLTIPEGVGLLMAARLAARFADRSMPFLADAYEKVAVALRDPAVTAAVADTAADLRGKRPDDLYTRVFSSVAAAWAGRRKLKLTYTQPREFTRVVWPLLVDASLGGHVTYLIAWEEKRGVPRSYRLDRVTDARVLDESFDPPLGFTVGQMLEHAWGIWAPDGAPVEVELIFSVAAARRVTETEWHRSQRPEVLSDGRVRMLLTVGSTIELKPWVLGWGREVEVVAPPEFRAAIAADLAAAAEAYGAPVAAQSATTPSIQPSVRHLAVYEAEREPEGAERSRGA